MSEKWRLTGAFIRHSLWSVVGSDLVNYSCKSIASDASVIDIFLLTVCIHCCTSAYNVFLAIISNVSRSTYLLHVASIISIA